MFTAQLIAKTIGISIVAFVALFVAAIMVLAMGMPPGILAPVAWVGFAAIGYFKSRDLWHSRKPWAWAMAGFFLGVLAFPFFWYCYEHYHATSKQVEIRPEVSPGVQVEAKPALVPSLTGGATAGTHAVTH